MAKLEKRYMDFVRYVCGILELKSAGGKALLTVELILLPFLLIVLSIFLFHDLLIVIIDTFSGTKGDHYVLPVSVVTLIIGAFSVGAVFIREMFSTFLGDDR